MTELLVRLGTALFAGSHTQKAFKSHCVKKDGDALIRCMGSSCGKTVTGT